MDGESQIDLQRRQLALLDKAERLYAQVWQGRIAVLGAEHEETTKAHKYLEVCQLRRSLIEQELNLEHTAMGDQPAVEPSKTHHVTLESDVQLAKPFSFE